MSEAAKFVGAAVFLLAVFAIAARPRGGRSDDWLAEWVLRNPDVIVN